MNPWFLTGFSDGESNFTIRIVKSNSVKVGWVVQPVFQIGLHKKDINLLEKIQAFWGVGEIYHKEESCNYMVLSLRDLKVIINHFDNYPLITKKQADYLLFKQVLNLINNKQHLTDSGLNEIVSIKASMNLGLSDKLKAAFKIIPVDKPCVLNFKIKDPHWLSGFTSAEGCFMVRVINSSWKRLGFQVQLVFQISQHVRDELLIRSFTEYFNCGKIYKRQNVYDFKVTKYLDLTNKILPFFNNYPLQGVKVKDFLDFCKVAKIIEKKDHLIKDGLEQIRKIKINMNIGRKSP
jgi:hypothetical protein